MRTFKTGFLAVLLFVSKSVYSQQQDSLCILQGKVLNTTAKPIEKASISLYSEKDSVAIQNVFTNKEGLYIFNNIKPGKYRITISVIGFKTFYKDSIMVNSESIYLPDFKLEAQAKQLDHVVVTANKPMIENKIGKMIVNVDASPTNAGTTALELLEKAPGVTVSSEGQVSLKGKAGVLILVDGKQTYLSGNDLSNMLKNMSSSSIDQIEVMTSPPAKYDAAGNAGVINIKTKKSAIKGANASVSSSYMQGIYPKATHTATVNYRNNAINIFGNFNYTYREGFNNLSLDRNFYNAAQTNIVASSDQKSSLYQSSNNHRSKIGLDYAINKKNIIGITLTRSASSENSTSTSNSNIRDSITSILKSNTHDDNIYINGSSNLNYKGVLDTIGTELNIDADYAYYMQKNNSALNTNPFDANGNSVGMPLILDGKLPSFIRIYSGKVDFVHPFKKGIKLEAGLKTSFVNTNNRVDYLRQQRATWIKDSRSNHFIYDENINAGYANASIETKKWNVQLGLRVENTQSKGTQITTDTAFKKRYTNFFPNVNVGYHLNDKNDINFSYNRRINRPDYESLNPFIFFLDSLTYQQGNVNLRPEFSNNFELSHVFNGKIITTLNYSRTNDVITQLLKQNTTEKLTYQTTDNVNTLDNIGIAVSAPIKIKKWWMGNIYMNVFNNHYKGVYQNDPLNVSVTSFLFNMTNNFIICKGLTAELSGFYRSKGAEGLFIINPIYTVNAGISKVILHNKGTIKLSARDIFYTMKFSGSAKYSDIDTYLNGAQDSRVISLSFSYRFGNQKIAAARKRTTGKTEEENRVKKGEVNL